MAMNIRRVPVSLRVILVAVGLVAVELILAAIISGRSKQPVSTADLQTLEHKGLRIAGPYAYRNLSVFLIHGEDKVERGGILTLQEAMEQGKIVVHETGDVGELSVENLCDQEVFIQAGDIVKGGCQDRVMPFDILIAANPGRQPVGSFCVEQGRWSGRGGEAVGHFSASTDLVATKRLKLAVRRARSQNAVWGSVAETQDRLSASLGGSVRSRRSASSLQLSLENERVRGATETYADKLLGIVDGKTDVIGFAYAVNGQLGGIDVFANGELFRKLWPKMLKAGAVEAVAEFQKGRGFVPASVGTVRGLMQDGDRGKVSDHKVNRRIWLRTRETASSVYFETLDGHKAWQWVHRSYLAF
jgi:hypothetical protein